MGQSGVVTRLAIVAALALLAAMASGCSAKVSEQDAEAVARQFISEHVKFFSRDSSAIVDVAMYNFSSIQAAEEKGAFAFKLHVTASLGNETKESDVFVKVDKRTAKVFELNGKKVPG